MNRTMLFSGAVLVAVVALLIAIYYAIPGVYHILVTGSHPPLSPQPAHIVLFAGIAVLAALVALLNRPRSARRF